MVYVLEAREMDQATLATQSFPDDLISDLSVIDFSRLPRGRDESAPGIEVGVSHDGPRNALSRLFRALSGR